MYFNMAHQQPRAWDADACQPHGGEAEAGPRFRRVNARDLPKLPSYTGKEKLDSLVAMFKERGQQLGWNEPTLRLHFTQSLGGKAGEFYYALGDRQWLDFDDIVDRLKARFDEGPTNRMEAVAQLHNIRQGKEENLYDYAARVTEVASLANPDGNEAQAIPFFLTGILDKFKNDATFQVYQAAMNEGFHSIAEVIQALKGMMRSANAWGQTKTVRFQEPVTTSTPHVYMNRVSREKGKSNSYDSRNHPQTVLWGSPSYNMSDGTSCPTAFPGAPMEATWRGHNAAPVGQPGAGAYYVPVPNPLRSDNSGEHLSYQNDEKYSQSKTTDGNELHQVDVLITRTAAVESSQADLRKEVQGIKAEVKDVRTEVKDMKNEIKESMSKLDATLKLIIGVRERPRSSSPNERGGAFYNRYRSPGRGDSARGPGSPSPMGCHICGVLTHMKIDCPHADAFLAFQNGLQANPLNEKGVVPQTGNSHP